MTKLGLKAGIAGLVASMGLFAAAGSASAAITPAADASQIAAAINNAESNPAGSITGASFAVTPPNGNPAAVADTELALFPLNGLDYALLSTGDTTLADSPNDSESLSTDNGGGAGGHNGGNGDEAFDVVTVQIDLDVPEDRNCLTIDYRLLSEEFSEFVGSQYNDAFLAELDGSNFTVNEDGSVDATRNFAVGPDGKLTTINTAGTSADNALGTTYDGGTPILRATTPITAGAHSIYLTVYDATDAIFDTTTLIDNLRLRDTDPDNCKLGATGNEGEAKLCKGQEPTVFATGGKAFGTKGDDVILGSNGVDKIRGRGGDDLICGRKGDDKLIGGGGKDDINGNRGADLIIGNGGNDELHGNRGHDKVRGGSGSDDVLGGLHDDNVRGGDGDDRVDGRQDDDRVRGNAGNDIVRGAGGTDDCRGGSGNDKLVGCES